MKDMKYKDKDKAGISTGTTKIEPFHGEAQPEFDSTKVSQKPKAGGVQNVSRGQKIKC